MRKAEECQQQQQMKRLITDDSSERSNQKVESTDSTQNMIVVLTIREDLVGLPDLSEHVLGMGFVLLRMLIRMPLQRHLAISSISYHDHIKQITAK
jgi:hypothetical protein